MMDRPKDFKDNMILSESFHQHTRQYALIIIAITTIVYSNTFQAPFIFDDEIHIIKNPSIRGTPSVYSAFFPASDNQLSRRPFINFTLAVNYMISGLSPWSYHVFNLLIHILAALVLFGVIRRTFLFSIIPEPFRKLSLHFSFASALIWAIHPLQTQAVTYTIQRCESVMGLCFFLVFYFAIRGWQAKNQTVWHLASVLAFLVGVVSKEVIVTAPLLLFYYDILFTNKSIRVAIKRSPILYSGLALGMIVLGFHVISGRISSPLRQQVYSVYEYWLTQPKVTLHYIRLAFWPSPLSISYEWPASDWADAWPACILFIILIIITVRTVIKRHLSGFLAVWFFLILSPTMIMPLAIAFEHRMYLPLASIVILSVILICLVDNVIKMRLHTTHRKYFLGYQRWKWCFFILMCICLCILTFCRNADYRDKISLWKDAAQKYPKNSTAHAHLGQALMEKGLNSTALVVLNDALQIEKKNAKIYSESAPDTADKDALYFWYLAIRPIYAMVKNNMGLISLNQGNLDAALAYFEAALRVNPNRASVHSNMGLALIRKGRVQEAAKAFTRAIAADPKFTNAYVNMGTLLRVNGKPAEAAFYFKEAIRLIPDNVIANYGMAMVLHQLKKDSEAVLWLKKALQLNPDFKPANDALRRIEKSIRTY